MATSATTVFQAAGIVACTGYLIRPAPLDAAGNEAIQGAERVANAVTQTASEVFQAAVRQVVGSRLRDATPDQGPGADEVTTPHTPGWYALDEGRSGPAQTARQRWPPAPTVETAPPTPASPAPATQTPAASAETVPSPPASPSPSPAPETDSTIPIPSKAFAPHSPTLPTLSKAELSNLLDAIDQRRTKQPAKTQHRIQKYHKNVGRQQRQDDSPKKKGKKTVRFTLDTKPGSVEKGASPKTEEDKLISPIAPPASTELTYISSCIGVPDGSVFAHPTNEFDEADLIRRLPSQMKNGAGGLAYCRGRTERRLYLIDSPIKRFLLDLRAGVCYDGSSGRMLTVDEVMVCMLWGRGQVEEKWVGFRWSRGLDAKGI